MKKSVICIFLALTLLIGAVLCARADAVVLPALKELECAKATFSQPYDVYSGPGYDYYRANGGKAQYGGKDCRVWGRVGDWLLMGYKLSNGDFRVGYIVADALNHVKSLKGTVPELDFSTVAIGYADNSCRLTDDPVLNNKTIYTVPQGTAFSVLATFQTEGGRIFDYVEVSTPEGVMRAFVLANHVIYQNGQAPATPIPTPAPTPQPTKAPSPTQAPWTYPTAAPTAAPTYQPWTYPTAQPWTYPTAAPTLIPTYKPWTYPTAAPTAAPTYQPWTYPTTAVPTYPPYSYPTAIPWVYPTATPSSQVPNTYYHDQTKGTWFPSTLYVNFSGSWPVYSGPGTYYYRAAEGKATMGGGNCILYGVENNWALIGYSLSNMNFRIGYVSAAAIPQLGLNVPYLDFANKTGRVTAASSLTEDIVRHYTAVATVPANTYVLFLGYIKDASNNTWAFIEVLIDNVIMRGFIPAANLALQ